MSMESMRLFDKHRQVVHDATDTGMQYRTRCGLIAFWLFEQWLPLMKPVEEDVSCAECLEE
jgi:hypothetical protein